MRKGVKKYLYSITLLPLFLKKTWSVVVKNIEKKIAKDVLQI